MKRFNANFAKRKKDSKTAGKIAIAGGITALSAGQIPGALLMAKGDKKPLPESTFNKLKEIGSQKLKHSEGPAKNTQWGLFHKDIGPAYDMASDQVVASRRVGERSSAMAHEYGHRLGFKGESKVGRFIQKMSVVGKGAPRYALQSGVVAAPIAGALLHSEDEKTDKRIRAAGTAAAAVPGAMVLPSEIHATVKGHGLLKKAGATAKELSQYKKIAGTGAASYAGLAVALPSLFYGAHKLTSTHKKKNYSVVDETVRGAQKHAAVGGTLGAMAGTATSIGMLAKYAKRNNIPMRTLKDPRTVVTILGIIAGSSMAGGLGGGALGGLTGGITGIGRGIKNRIKSKKQKKG